MLRKLFDLFLFSSLFIALCAVLMTEQANQLLQLDYQHKHYWAFVFFSTICSYNFHWYLTPDNMAERSRAAWTRRHRKLHLLLFAIGLMGAAWFFLYFTYAWFWLSIPAVLTFLYSAPKLPYSLFGLLKRVAVGKTIFLAFVWTYVTTISPVMLSSGAWDLAALLFVCSRFFLVYAICILFDYRDREDDRRDGIRSMVTYFSEKGIDNLFYISLAAFALSTAALYVAGIGLPVIAAVLVPGIIVLLLYNKAKRNFSDYLYYFVLDGLMMLSALFTLFIF
jgi:4-hydroxybenzoate polyprenyltransferase